MNATQIYRGTENEINPEIEKDETIENTIKYLEKFKFQTVLSIEDQKKLLNYAPKLKPDQILTISKYLERLPENHYKSDYLDVLILKSYHNANNDFYIFNNRQNWSVIEKIGEESRKLKITYLSEVHRIGLTCTSCELTANEKVSYAGRDNKYCIINLKNLTNLVLQNSFNTTYKIHGKLENIRRIERYEKIKLILNPEQYKKWKPELNDDKEITLEIIK